jgi:hypothetical protein
LEFYRSVFYTNSLSAELDADSYIVLVFETSFGELEENTGLSDPSVADYDDLEQELVLHVLFLEREMEGEVLWLIVGRNCPCAFCLNPKVR